MLKRETIFAGEGGFIYKKRLNVNSPNPTRVEEEADDRLASGRGGGGTGLHGIYLGIENKILFDVCAFKILQF